MSFKDILSKMNKTVKGNSGKKIDSFSPDKIRSSFDKVLQDSTSRIQESKNKLTSVDEKVTELSIIPKSNSAISADRIATNDRIKSIGSSVSNNSMNKGGSFGSSGGDGKSSDGEKRPVRHSMLLGKLSSFFHVKDLEYLQSFIDKVAHKNYEKQKEYIEFQVKMLERVAKKLASVDKKLRDSIDNQDDLKKLLEQVMSYDFGGKSGDGYFLGGPSDSDEFKDDDASVEKRDNLLRDNRSTDTVLTSRSVLFYKEPFLNNLNFVGNIQATFLSIVNRIFLLRKLEFLLNNLSGSESRFEVSKSSLESQKNDTKTYFNISNQDSG